MTQPDSSRIQCLYDALQDEDEEERTKAADIIRTLVEGIVLTPMGGDLPLNFHPAGTGALWVDTPTRAESFHSGS
ncbi:MAG: hypothetical protein KDC18_17125 [Alphaproteobacteria bacterium]|nr:hypothetical protein [Alphaproteobacteria bacterium]